MNWILDLFKGFDSKSLGNLLSGGAQAYGAWKQGKAANDIAKLQLKDYEDEKKRKERTQGYINNSFAKLPLT